LHDVGVLASKLSGWWNDADGMTERDTEDLVKKAVIIDCFVVVCTSLHKSSCCTTTCSISFSKPYTRPLPSFLSHTQGPFHLFQERITTAYTNLCIRWSTCLNTSVDLVFTFLNKINRRLIFTTVVSNATVLIPLSNFS
jgi:hypothetical protein